ncbi:hypothetical protein [Mycobacteroides abscessus]|nr:hypothetical protein [Mycobacteroides abscessus]SIK11172.1 Uncharacterised protein [Mycobacteroides abscessus subsp. abscessus]SLG32522.1 Uncharacterised protein [Mycobacteroides abscessus subsp. abscessus]
MNTRDSIRAAMERLLAGTPEHTDGRLTKPTSLTKPVLAAPRSTGNTT